jgi:CSLREA domain-containing protein
MNIKFFCRIYAKRLFFLIFTLLFAAVFASAATITVTTDADENGSGADCSLREAVASANSDTPVGGCAAGAGADSIVFAMPFFGTAREIRLATGELRINSPVTINGTGAHLLTLRNIQAASGTSRVFLVFGGVASLTLSGATVTGGNVTSTGGGISTSGTLNLTNVHITGNASSSYGGGLLVGSGTTTIMNSTISNNVGNLSVGGGGIDNSGTLLIVNSTISGNTKNGAGANGGGLYNFGGTTTITNSTIADNLAPGAGSAGGAFRANGTVTVRNTIIAANRNNATFADAGGAFVSAGYNLVGNAGTASGFTATADRTNVSNSDVKLYPLNDYGGQTPTHKLYEGSFAIDSGFDFGATTDQRGAPRTYDDPATPNAPGGSGTEIGAFELQIPTAAGVSVSGRVLDETGRGIFRASVSMTDQNGITRTTRTNNFGQYSFTGVAVGETYIFNVFTKRYQFDPLVRTISEDLYDLDFTPQMGFAQKLNLAMN